MLRVNNWSTVIPGDHGKRRRAFSPIHSSVNYIGQQSLSGGWCPLRRQQQSAAVAAVSVSRGWLELLINEWLDRIVHLQCELIGEAGDAFCGYLVVIAMATICRWTETSGPTGLVHVPDAWRRDTHRRVINEVASSHLIWLGLA